jgi:spermidine synthase
VRTPLLYLLFLLSGAAGLIYELVWVRELIFVFGGTTYAITTVLVAFMGGLGLGCFFAGRWCHRLERPGHTYGVLEICIGLYALCVPFLLNVAEPGYRALYPHLANQPWLLNLVRFGVGGLILIVPTTFMGATLPILVRYVTLQGGALGRSVGHLYGINTFGAVLGTLAAGFVLIPTLGLLHTTWLAATLNIVIGIVAVNLLNQTAQAAAPARAAAARADALAAPPLSGRLRQVVLVGFAVSGFAAMVYQITWSRALVMAVGSTTYAFTCILAAFILGLALGSLAIARWADRWKDPVFVFGVLELLIGLIAVVIVPIHGRVPLIVADIIDAYSKRHNGAVITWQFYVTWQFLLIIAITFVPTFLMGAIFPLATRALAGAGDEAGAATGRAYLVNTIGTIAGSFLAGFVLIRSDVLGIQNSIILASLLNGIVGLALVLLARRPTGAAFAPRAAVAGVLLVLIPVVAVATGRWDRHTLTAAPFMMRHSATAAREIVYYGEGVDVTVSVEHPAGLPQLLTMRVNGKPDASTDFGDMVTMLLLGHVPALVGPEARTACMVGLGSGLSLGALACHPSFEQIDCVEISDDVIRGAQLFNPYTYNVLNRDPRVHMILADGRNHLLLTDRTYDMIITQPSNPWMAGVSNLFTREYFELGRRRLTDRGVSAVWLQGYRTSLRDFQMIVRTLFEVFPHVSLWELNEDDFLMIASPQALQLDFTEFTRRFRTPTVRADLYRVSVRRPADVLSRYVASDQTLREWVALAPIHTDDNALLEFSAPRQMFIAHRTIAAALYLLQRSPVTDLVRDPATVPAEFVRELENAVAARWVRIRGDELMEREDVAGALRLLLDTYATCPHNAQLYRFIMYSHDGITDSLRKRQIPAQPEVAALLERIAQLPPPRGFAPLTGATLAQLATTQRGLAQAAAQRGQWPAAVALLREAHDLQPEDTEVTRALANALGQVGQLPDAARILDDLLARRPEDGAANYLRAVIAAHSGDPATALQRLEQALQWGAVSAAQLASDPNLEPLHADPRFQALLTPPTTAPAAP